MAQPTKLPRWMNDTTGVDVTKTTEPTSGKADVGFADLERPGNQYINFFFYWVYKWLQYLAGLVGGTETFTNMVATSSTIATLTVTGAPGVKHPVDFQYIAAGDMHPMTDAAPWAEGAGGLYWNSGTGSGTAALIIPIRLSVYDRLLSIQVILKDGGATHKCTVNLWKTQVDGTTTQAFAAVVNKLSTGGGTVEAVQVDCTGPGIAGDGFYQILVTAQNNAASVYGAIVAYDRP